MSQSLLDVSQSGRRASALGAQERLAISAVLAPHMQRFDAWLKEAALLNAMALASATNESDRQRLRARCAELAVEVEASFERYAADTVGFAKASRINELTQSYRRLLSMLRVHGAA